MEGGERGGGGGGVFQEQLFLKWFRPILSKFIFLGVAATSEVLANTCQHATFVSPVFQPELQEGMTICALSLVNAGC